MLITFDELPAIRSHHRHQKIVYMGGTFDPLHYGHVNAFEVAKALGDVLVVSVDSDEAAKHYTGAEHPIIPQEQRAAMVEALRVVDYVLINPMNDPKRHFNEMKVIEALKPDVFATPHAEGWGPFLEELKQRSTHIAPIHPDPDAHTSDLLARIRTKS